VHTLDEVSFISVLQRWQRQVEGIVNLDCWVVVGALRRI
jgi:hypothetical protein